MSRRARLQPAAAASRRTRRGEQHAPPPPSAALAEGPKIVSNPIFRCEAGPGEPKLPGDTALRCVYRPNSLYALVHDPAAAATANGGNNGVGKPLPLPLPPCRAHRSGPGAGSRMPASRSGPVVVSAGRHGIRVLRKQAPQDPFLAAYVACSKGGNGGTDAADEVDRHQHKQKQGKKKKNKAATKRRAKEGEKMVRGCGIWSGWAAGARYAGAMSCRHGCTVAEQQQGDAPTTAAKEEARDDAPVGPTLDLSWAPAVLSARTLERRRELR